MLGVVSALAAPAAQAESGRRICLVTNVTGYKADGSVAPGLQTSDGAEYKEVWVVDYKKDGACPLPSKANSNTAGLPTLANHLRSNDNNKQTCESFAMDWNLPGDPCTSMANDTLYQVRAYHNVSIVPGDFVGGGTGTGSGYKSHGAIANFR
jgi:hypothetical protein